MADIEVVIKIPDDLYKGICSDAEIMIYGGMRSGKTLLATLLRAIRIGKPLPKKHGRLKDVDYGLKNCKDEHEIEYWDKEVPTIIEADKESKDANSH